MLQGLQLAIRSTGANYFATANDAGVVKKNCKLSGNHRRYGGFEFNAHRLADAAQSRWLQLPTITNHAIH